MCVSEPVPTSPDEWQHMKPREPDPILPSASPQFVRTVSHGAGLRCFSMKTKSTRQASFKCLIYLIQ